MVGSTALWLFMAIDVFSDVFSTLGDFFFLLIFGLVLAMAWFAWSLSMRRGESVLRTRWDVAQWVFVPSVGLLGLTLALSIRDNVLRLKLSEPALRRCLADYPPVGPIDYFESGSRRVGLFWFQGMSDANGRVEFWSSNRSYPDGGLIYSPTGRPQKISSEWRYRHLSGPWWSFTKSF